MMRRIRAAALATLLLAVVATFFYFGSCVYGLYKLADAARSQDGATVLDRTDLPRLRASLTQQIVAAYEARVGQKKANALTQILRNVRPGLADQIIAQLLTPDRLTELLRQGTIPGSSAGADATQSAPLADVRIQDAIGQIRFINPVTVGFRTSADRDRGYTVIMHFEAMSWKLSGVELPQTALDRLISRLPG